MNKRERQITVGVVVAASVAALSLVVLCIRPPFTFYSMSGLQILPTRLIRQAVRFTTNQDLPETADAAQAMIFGGRDTSVFVRFHTDKAGVQHVLRVFGGPDAKTETLDHESLQSWMGFGMLEQWQKRLGISMYDPNSIRSATVMTCSAFTGPGYVVLVDRERDDIYILGMQR